MICVLCLEFLHKQIQDLNLEERTACRAALKSILGTVYQPIVIKELLILQGGPKQVEITFYNFRL